VGVKKKRTIYCISHYKYKDGSIGKVGCTSTFNRRMKQINATGLPVKILEEFISGVVYAARRERFWQRKLGCKLDCNSYLSNWATSLTDSQRSKFGRKGGSISGPITVRRRLGIYGRSKTQHSVDSRHAGLKASIVQRENRLGLFSMSKRARSIAGQKGGRIGGKIGGKISGPISMAKVYRCHCGHVGRGASMFRWHFQNCKRSAA
jgi:hypothetical protein